MQSASPPHRATAPAPRRQRLPRHSRLARLPPTGLRPLPSPSHRRLVALLDPAASHPRQLRAPISRQARAPTDLPRALLRLLRLIPRAAPRPPPAVRMGLPRRQLVLRARSQARLQARPRHLPRATCRRLGPRPRLLRPARRHPRQPTLLRAATNPRRLCLRQRAQAPTARLILVPLPPRRQCRPVLREAAQPHRP